MQNYDLTMDDIEEIKEEESKNQPVIAKTKRYYERFKKIDPEAYHYRMEKMREIDEEGERIRKKDIVDAEKFRVIEQ